MDKCGVGTCEARISGVSQMDMDTHMDMDMEMDTGVDYSRFQERKNTEEFASIVVSVFRRRRFITRYSVIRLCPERENMSIVSRCIA